MESLDWLAETKFIQPALNQHTVQRDRLLNLLKDAVQNSRLTLISAPAGAGKTTLLASLAKSLPEFPITWLSLDEEDNDPLHFLIALIVALQHLKPEFGQLTLQRLKTIPGDSLSQLRRIVGSLINETIVDLPTSFGVVFDDLHWVNKPLVYQVLDYLLERLPSQMHLIIATRYEPQLSLARLRAREQLTEFKLADLRFNQNEVASFFNNRLALNLSQSDLQLLENRTEGWAAGLSMLASTLGLQLKNSPDYLQLLNNTLPPDRYLFDYLAGEVLDQQDLTIRTFLLETSILSELTPEMCEAVTGRDDAALLLEEIYQRNLFLIALDGPERVYRYHDLFATFLQAKLVEERPSAITNLHKCAAHAQISPGKAIHHYLVAELWLDAAEAIEQIAQNMWQQGLITNLATWIEAIPTAFRLSRPWLTCYLGRCVWQKKQPEQARELFEAALSGFEASKDRAGRGEALAGLVGYHLLHDHFDNSSRLIQEALTCPLSPQIQVQLLMAQARLASFKQDWEQAEQNLVTALTVCQKSSQSEVLHLCATYFHPTFVTLPGVVKKLEGLCRQISKPQFNNLSIFNPTRVAMDGQLAYVYLWRGRFKEAIALSQLVIDHSENLGLYPYLEFLPLIIISLAQLGLNNYPDAQNALELIFERFAHQGISEGVVPGLLYLLAKIYWYNGHLEKARETYERMVQLDTILPGAIISQKALLGLLEMSTQNYSVAEQIFLEGMADEDRILLSNVYGSIRINLAYLYFLWNKPEKALRVLTPLLAYHEQESTPGFILKEGRMIIPLLQLALSQGVHPNFVKQMLVLAGETPLAAEPVSSTPKIVSKYIPQTGETLTAREVEVLHLLIIRASNREIAQEFVISEATVKTHVSSVLRKLNLSSRNEVARRAEELGLL